MQQVIWSSNLKQRQTDKLCLSLFKLIISLIVSFLATDSQTSEEVCNYQDVLNYLNLTKNNELFFMTRPVKDYKRSTAVNLEVVLYAILDVVSS